MYLLTELNEFIADIGVNYAICGGHAIDLFLDRKTRTHKDLDVAVFWEDRNKVVQYMIDNGWEVYEPCGMEHLHKINNIQKQKLTKSNIWCIKPGNPHYTFIEYEKDMFAVEFDDSEQIELNYIEFLFNTRKDKDFLYARNHDIKMKLGIAIMAADGIPYIAPELVLLYKSTAADEMEYQLDFDNTFPKLNKEQVVWLKNALHTMFPTGHKWIDSINICIP